MEIKYLKTEWLKFFPKIYKISQVAEAQFKMHRIKVKMCPSKGITGILRNTRYKEGVLNVARDLHRIT